MRAARAPDEKSLSYEFVTMTNHDSKIAKILSPRTRDALGKSLVEDAPHKKGEGAL